MDLVVRNVGALSDGNLLDLCDEYGSNAKLWLKKFAGLLPEVFKRRLYKRKGCVSIHEYAKKVAGMNEATVDKILRLRRKLEGKPALLRLFESGSEGWGKLEKVAGIATVENDVRVAETVKNSSARVLGVFVQEYKKNSDVGGYHVKNKICQDGRTMMNFRLAPEVEEKLRLFKQKCEKEKNEPLCWNDVIRELLYGKCERERVVVKVCPDCARRKGLKAKSRTIPVDVKRLIDAEYGKKCIFDGCNLPAENYHHT
ncbi:MAG: hypothetical protein V1679_00645, partial [Candidatus Peregrinibacteria bacterium]